MSTNLTELPQFSHVHAGPAQEAALIIATAPALADHVLVSQANDGSENCVIISHRTDDVPITMWGSGAQGMWELLLSITERHPVVISDVVVHLDRSNRAAVGIALAALCRP